MWRLLQVSVFLAVLFSDAAYHWSNNSYATGFLAAYAAYVASCVVYSLFNWRAELVPRCFHKRHEDRPPLPRVGPKRLR